MERMHGLQSGASSPMQSMSMLDARGDLAGDFFRSIQDGDIQTVSCLLQDHRIGLAAIDGASGKTALHLAISLGHDEIAKRLLEEAGTDPCVLDAHDREQYTPLMRAALMKNVAMMQALIQAGASTDRLALSGGDPALKPFDLFAIRMLSIARGDLSTAFEDAVTKFNSDLATLFFDAGADSLLVLRNCVKKHNWREMVWMIDEGFAREGEFLSVLSDMLRVGYGQAGLPMPRDVAASSIMQRPWNAIRDLSDSAKVEALSIFLKAGSPIDGLVQRVVWSLSTQREDEWDKKMDMLRLLFAAGASSAGAFMSLAERGDRRSVQRLLSFGADFFTPMITLRNRRDNASADVIADEAMKYVIQRQQPDALKIARLKDVMFGGGMKAAVQLLRDEVNATRFDAVAVAILIAAKVPTTEVLMELARERKRESARKMIELGADVASAMNFLCVKAKYGGVANKHEVRRRAQDAANELALALASYLIPRGPSNPGGFVQSSQ